MIAPLAKLYQPDEGIQGRNAIFRIDNANAFDEVVKNSAKPTVIVAMTHLIWQRIHELAITPWFQWIHGARNIADLPARKVGIPFK